MSIEEIAEVTGTSPGDGRKDRVLARAWLRRELNDIAEPHE
jgi:hypothetical protein